MNFKAPPKYKLGEILFDEMGNWWVNWQGNHVQQGGPSFSYGNMGSEDLEFLLKIVAKDMLECKDLYEEQIKKKQGVAE